MSPHRSLTEPSLSPHARKGREGKGIGREELVTHCMTVTGGTDAASCNATDAIEHLDWQPPCDGKEHVYRGEVAPPAQFQVVAHGCACVPALRLWCGGCVSIDQWNATQWRQCRPCEVCGVRVPLPQAIRVEPLC